MAQIKPFCAVRYPANGPALATKLCPPYDIISPQEKAQLHEMDPYNFVHLELPDGADPYATAQALLERWLQEGALVKDDREGLYVYEEEFTVQGQPLKIKGFVAAVKLEEFSKGIVLPHEETLSKAKEDRLNMMKATGANLSLIYSMFADQGRVQELLDESSAGTPHQQATTDDGIVHRLWIAQDQETLSELCALFEDKKLYIADGHHRYETAINYRNHLRQQGLAKEGDAADYVMMFLIDMAHPGLVVFPTHRMVRGLESYDPEAVLAKLQQDFTVTKVGCRNCMKKAMAQAAEGQRVLGYYAGNGNFYTLQPLSESATDPITDHCQAYKELDVTALHYLILEKHFGIDKANMANQKNLVYTRDLDQAIEQVDQGLVQCAFFLNPTKIHQISQVALAGDKMPQKSTYFYPKLTTGLVMRKILD